MTIPFTLGPEHADFRAVVADFAQRDLAPHVERWNAAKEAPLEAIKLMGDLGLFGLGGPEEYGGAGDFTSLCIAIEEIGKVDQSLGITLEAAVGLGINPIAHFGTAGAEAALAARPAGRARAGRVRADRGGVRLRRGRHPDPGGAAGRPVGDQRQQAVHHQLRHRHHLAVHGDRADRHPGQRQAGDLHHRGAAPAPPGFVVEPAYAKLGWHASDTHPLTFTDVAVPEDHLLGVRGPGLRPVPVHPGRRSGGHRRAGAGLHPGLPGALGRVRAASARRSAGRSAASRGWRSRSPTWT